MSFYKSFWLSIILYSCSFTVCLAGESRESLGIKTSDNDSCITPILSVYTKEKFNPQVAANDYLSYSMAALESYPDMRERLKDKGYELERLSTWKHIYDSPPTDRLNYSYYSRKNTEKGALELLIAFAGTQPRFWDFMSNIPPGVFSRLARYLGYTNQYDDSLQAVKKVRNDEMIKAAKDKLKLSIIVTGHSKGGGQAVLVAHAFPCTVAVTFNKSFIENEFLLEQPYNPKVVNIYNPYDELTELNRKVSNDDQTESYQHYNILGEREKNGKFHHSMEELSVNMAGYVADCQSQDRNRKDKNVVDCQVPKDDYFAQMAYCSTYGKDDVGIRKNGEFEGCHGSMFLPHGGSKPVDWLDEFAFKH